jgi:hypothetical protein
MQTKCFTRARVPEYYALLPAIHGRGKLWLMFLLQQFELAERSGCWSRLRAFRHGSHRLRKEHLAGKATTFSPLGSSGGDFNLKLRRKELHL